MSSQSLPLIKVIGAGGTISEWGAPRMAFFDYDRGQYLDISQILERVPEVNDIARVEAEQMWQTGDPEVGGLIWLRLANRINRVLLEEPETCGVVVTSGTSPLEETAYFLNLTVKSDKPVVVTGSMRPPSAMGTDADNNIIDAIRLASAEEARGKGVLTVLNSEIQAAREVTKQNTYRLDTFGSPDLGILGYVDADLRVVFYRSPTRKHTYQTEFDVAHLDKLPRVYVVSSVVGDDGLLVRALIREKAPGLVSASPGNGRAGPEFMRALHEARENGLVVVVSSRVGSGRVISTSHMRGLVASDNLSPQKARILLMLGLTLTDDVNRIQRMFEIY